MPVKWVQEFVCNTKKEEQSTSVPIKQILFHLERHDPVIINQKGLIHGLIQYIRRT